MALTHSQQICSIGAPRAARDTLLRIWLRPPAHVPSPCPFPRQGSGLSAVDLPGNWEVPGPQAPKTTQNFYKKARSAFLFI